MAFVVVLHLSPDHESNLAEILRRDTNMPVQEATDECALEAGHIYVIPPHREMWLERRPLRLSARSPNHRTHPTAPLLASPAVQHRRLAVPLVPRTTRSAARLCLRSTTAPT